MTKERTYKKEYAKELISIAEGDLNSARALAKATQGRPENIFFLVHQAIEKSLKSVLCAKGLPVPLIHDLALLVDRLPKGNDLPFAEDIVELSQFATIRRYEEGYFEFTKEEIEKTLHAAIEILEWCKKTGKK